MELNPTHTGKPHVFKTLAVLLGGFLVSTAYAGSPGAIAFTYAVCSESGVESVVDAAEVSHTATVSAIVEQQAAQECAVSSTPFPVLLLERHSTYQDFENDDMEVWRVTGANGKPIEQRLFIWKKAAPSI